MVESDASVGPSEQRDDGWRAEKKRCFHRLRAFEEAVTQWNCGGSQCSETTLLSWMHSRMHNGKITQCSKQTTKQGSTTSSTALHCVPTKPNHPTREPPTNKQVIQTHVEPKCKKTATLCYFWYGVIRSKGQMKLHSLKILFKRYKFRPKFRQSGHFIDCLYG